MFPYLGKDNNSLMSPVDWQDAFVKQYGTAPVPQTAAQFMGGPLNVHLLNITYDHSSSVRGVHASGDFIWRPYTARYLFSGVLEGVAEVTGRLITLPSGSYTGYEQGIFIGNANSSTGRHFGSLMYDSKFLTFNTDPSKNTLSMFLNFTQGTNQLHDVNGVASMLFNIDMGTGIADTQFIFPNR